ncbi:hypothetical protein GFS60_07826 (plasmid) [Rhodococcus sp. WAY2]|nr:hypothetical protein GFS60_07826 [Rhodococcus sp. WAY2]
MWLCAHCTPGGMSVRKCAVCPRRERAKGRGGSAPVRAVLSWEPRAAMRRFRPAAVRASRLADLRALVARLPAGAHEIDRLAAGATAGRTGLLADGDPHRAKTHAPRTYA